MLFVFCCFSVSAQVKLNEVQVRPGGNQGLIIFNGNSGNEYIELYNPSCSPVNVSGFFIGCRQEFAGTTSGGAFRIPSVPAATIAPGGHLVLGTATSSADANSIDIKLPDYTSNYCFNNATYNFILANADGWVALYNAQGTPIDAVFWSSSAGNISQAADFGGVPCVPAGSPGGVTLESAQQINASFPGVLSYAGVNPSAGLTFSRIPDGGTWQGAVTPSVNDLTVGNCNGGTCVTVGTISFTATKSNPTCTNANGTINISVTSTGTATYAWSANAAAGNSASATGLSAGTYSVTVTQNGCTKDTSIALTAASTISLTLTNAVNPTCAGNDGSITANLSGGTAPYTVTIDTGGTPFTINVPFAASQSLTGLYAGTVSASVIDASGCQASTSATLSAATNCCPYIINAGVTQPTCGSSNGSISITLTNGSGAYTYAWSANASTGNVANAINLAAGTYSVTVTQGTCTKDTTIIINSSSSINLSLSNPVNPTCAGNDGSITANLSGGTAPYTVTIDTGGTPFTINVPFAASQSLTGLYAGTVTASVVDASGCQASASATLSAATNCCPYIINAGVTQPTCGSSNGSISITLTNGSGAYTYAWSANASTGNVANAINLAAGTYSVTVTQGTCTKDTTIIINSSSSLNLSLSNPVNPTCAGNNGSITANLSGGTAPYTVTIDTGGTPFTIAIPIAITQTISNLPAGTVSVSVVDAAGCQSNTSAALSAPTNCCTFQINATLSPATCGNANGGISIVSSNGSGNYSYSWSANAAAGNNASASNLIANVYALTVTDNAYAGCLIDTSFNLTNIAGPTVTSVNNISETCAGTADGSITINTSGGTAPLTFTWSTNANTGNSATANTLIAGTYNFTVTDGNNCSATSSVTVTAGVCCNLQTNATATATKCGLDNGSITVNVLSGGLAPYQYSINGAIAQISNQFDSLAAANYSIVTTDANGCTSTATVVVPNSTNSVSVSVTATDITCNGLANGSAAATAAGGNGVLSYLWSNANTTTSIQSLVAGTYTVTVTDADGCAAFASATVTEPSELTISLGNNITVCSGETASLNAPAGFATYTWSTGDTTASISQVPVGNYSITATNTDGCTATTSIAVEPSNTTVDLGFDQDVFEGESVTLEPVVSGNAEGVYTWLPPTTLSCTVCTNPVATPTDTTIYYLSYIDENGCLFNDSITLNLLPEGKVYFPTVFSPNGDGRNDVFSAIGTGAKVYHLEIFNRWGERVYQTRDFSSGWDGTYKGVKAAPDVYVYVATVIYTNQKVENFKGSVMIIK